MAIYHLSFKLVRRSEGKSATAAAAYRAAEAIGCKRLGVVHDYSRRKGVLHTEIMAPTGLPDLDRERLWNLAESAEIRKDSCVAREIEIALPAELNHQQRLELVREFCREVIDQHGVVIDIALHAPGRGDRRNFHAHLLMTTRQMTAEGKLAAKTRDFDDLSRGPKLVRFWRKRWAELTNDALLRVGANVEVTHLARTPAEIAAGFEPMIHLGPFVAAEERAGIRTARGDRNREVARRNQQRRALRKNLKAAEADVIVAAMPEAERVVRCFYGFEEADEETVRRLDTDFPTTANLFRRMSATIRAQGMAQSRAERHTLLMNRLVQPRLAELRGMKNVTDYLEIAARDIDRVEAALFRASPAEDDASDDASQSPDEDGPSMG